MSHLARPVASAPEIELEPESEIVEEEEID